MKNLLFTLICSGIISSLHSQQSLSLRPGLAPGVTIAGGSSINFNSLSNWGLIGLGNLNLETFKDVNIAAKLSGYKRLNKANRSFTTLYFSFNKNATNNDSLLAGTFLFPDIGNASAAFTVDHLEQLGTMRNNNYHLIGPFFDFSYKTIKAERENKQKEFATLSYAFGVKYLNWHHENGNDFAFSVSLYASVINVPDEDNDNYRELFNSTSQLSSEISAVGIKAGVQVNNIQFYADFKTTGSNKEKIPVDALRGFNANVGVIFNAQLLEK